LKRHARCSVRVGMIVRIQLLLKVPHCFLQFFGFRFERFHSLLDFGMLVTVSFDGHSNYLLWRSKYYALTESISTSHGSQ